METVNLLTLSVVFGRLIIRLAGSVTKRIVQTSVAENQTVSIGYGRCRKATELLNGTRPEGDSGRVCVRGKESGVFVHCFHVVRIGFVFIYFFATVSSDSKIASCETDFRLRSRCVVGRFGFFF